MNRTNNISISAIAKKPSFITEFGVLVKFKLSTIVVLTSILAYAIGLAGSTLDMSTLFCLAVGGFSITFAANAMNQVLERDFDKLMDRTKDRPVASGRMTISNAVLISGVLSVIGIILLSMIGPVVALLGTVSYLLYAFVYTPLKRTGTIAVAIGAIPGALPILIGTTAAEGSITLFGLMLFFIQFFWQFPHFWAIGYLSFDDYSNANFKLLPEKEGIIDRNLGLSSTIYALLILPVCLVCYYLGNINIIELSSLMVLSIIYVGYSFNFHKQFDRVSARKLMFYSFFYIPVVLITLLVF